jgi:peptidoglycan/xylan/chitin deacetylase (PgdA/CDA1 family)
VKPSVKASPLLPFEGYAARPVGRVKDLVRRLISITARPFGTLQRVATDEPLIALTFDDGPHSTDTPRVLDVLARHGARGTFFVVGKSVAEQPEVMARMVEAGHAVGHHSWNHLSFPRLSEPERLHQFLMTSTALGSMVSTPFLFRPPFGEQSVASLQTARSLGYTVVTWDVVGEDWLDSSEEAILNRILRRLRRGSIVVLHDTLYLAQQERFRDRGPMLGALDKLLARLSGEFRFVTVPELLRSGRPVWGHHYHRVSSEFHATLR